MQPITREEVKSKLSGQDKVVLIETLPEQHFRKFHLPGAVSIPIEDDRFAEKVSEAVPDKDTPIIVYCQNQQCQASPKAARRLDEIGYQEVYDYEAGKEDWRDAGNPIES